jgi:hypothetical protein
MAAECSCANYSAVQKTASVGWDLSAVLNLPCAGINTKQQMQLEKSCSVTMCAFGGGVTAASFQLSLSEGGEGIDDKRRGRHVLVCWEAGESDGTFSDTSALPKTPASTACIEGMEAFRILVDTLAVSRARDLLMPS